MRGFFTNKVKGDFGEDYSCRYLKEKGYRIIEKNYKNQFGEIDIIAKDKENLVFVEVKTRGSDKFGSPAQAVNHSKKQHIINAARLYISKNMTDLNIRFDVIEVYASFVSGEFILESINHIENAFLL